MESERRIAKTPQHKRSASLLDNEQDDDKRRLRSGGELEHSDEGFVSTRSGRRKIRIVETTYKTIPSELHLQRATQIIHQVYSRGKNRREKEIGIEKEKEKEKETKAIIDGFMHACQTTLSSTLLATDDVSVALAYLGLWMLEEPVPPWILIRIDTEMKHAQKAVLYAEAAAQGVRLILRRKPVVRGKHLSTPATLSLSCKILHQLAAIHPCYATLSRQLHIT